MEEEGLTSGEALLLMHIEALPVVLGEELTLLVLVGAEALRGALPVRVTLPLLEGDRVREREGVLVGLREVLRVREGETVPERDINDEEVTRAHPEGREDTKSRSPGWWPGMGPPTTARAPREKKSKLVAKEGATLNGPNACLDTLELPNKAVIARAGGAREACMPAWSVKKKEGVDEGSSRLLTSEGGRGSRKEAE